MANYCILSPVGFSMTEKDFPEMMVKLGRKLKSVWADKEFVIGVLAFAKTDEERQQVLDFIDRDENVSPESILALAITLANKRKISN